MKTQVSDRWDRQSGHPGDFCSPSRSFACSAGSGIFARPNLKLFVLGAILILVAQALVSTAQTEWTKAIPTSSVAGSQVDLNRLLAAAREHPSFELLTRISQHYEKMGDYRQAIQYLRKADQTESAGDL